MTCRIWGYSRSRVLPQLGRMICKIRGTPAAEAYIAGAYDLYTPAAGAYDLYTPAAGAVDLYDLWHSRLGGD